MSEDIRQFLVAVVPLNDLDFHMGLPYSMFFFYKVMCHDVYFVKNSPYTVNVDGW